MSKSETPLLPQAAALLLVSYIVYRIFFTSSPTATVASASARRGVDPRRLQQQVETVRGMFPQFSAAAVEAELLRNGGNIETTTERILSTGFLPEPPQPATPAPPVPARSPAPAARPARPTPPSSSTPQLGPQYPDLITRYNLSARVAAGEGEAEEESVGGKGKAPANKADRMLAHKAKRDEMILTARSRVAKEPVV